MSVSKNIKAGILLAQVRGRSPVVHHLTNWVTIYDCAQVVKSLGASPVMAHALEEVEEMSGIASSLVLNIGTLTIEFVEAMKKAARAANKKGIPVILDVCGAGATSLRDRKCLELINEVRIDIIKGNASEIGRVAGENVRTKGVDSSLVQADIKNLAAKLATRKECTVVVTGEIDIVTDGKRCFLVANGNELMSKVVGTGCMAASVIGTFAAVEQDLVKAGVSGLVCFEVAAELAAKKSPGPGSFREKLFDCLYNLDAKTVSRMQKVRC
ncbi:MAG: hydroxyethylthiazole kinase [Candidatus Omnitrophica bacterium CG08_land_8_20_14_0_20_41_16]|uniref:Hydroxyethylthiazole kinase n=1 Tax=Candidatus Sherwoodlollariibacterium unditelluris TaxID=1974757 RepID=A0A2G9YLY1_9BACT|nr:MAG: hydroxyethylthiazole kinase [Candidatus Omnitrophica bacterium CG23_combo_of_CG06-09_8_20_14_all_41_10]PIS33997.1 MAG: hydroxyethylthiazole kinase [Candidatus Omnitrophica bacterium CG08_land_8_20_14_0_20_41_16]